MKALLSREEVTDYLADLTPADPEYDALIFLRDIYYAVDEGLVAMEGEHLYPTS